MITITIAQKKMLCRGGGRTDGHAEERRYSDGEDGGRSRHCEYHLLVLFWSLSWMVLTLLEYTSCPLLVVVIVYDIDGLDTVSITFNSVN